MRPREQAAATQRCRRAASLAAVLALACGLAFAQHSGRTPPASPRGALYIVDTDLAWGGDDSTALLMLLATREGRVLGVTTSAGNVWTAEATRNAERLLRAIDRADIPVHAGA